MARTGYLGTADDGNEYLNFEDKNLFVLLECVAHISGSTPYATDTAYVKVSVISIDADNRYLLLKADTGWVRSSYHDNSGWGAQHGQVYFKVYWEENHPCRVRPRKLFAAGTTIPQGAKATFELHEGSDVSNGVKKIVGSAKPGTKVLLWLGVNFLNSQGTFEYYKKIALQYKKLKFYAISVTGVVESVGIYKVKNENIKKFNIDLKNRIQSSNISNLRYKSILYQYGIAEK
jgi:hypothetical protein